MYEIRAMQAADLPAVRRLVESTQGLNFQKWETMQFLENALETCPGLSQVAVKRTGEVVACVFVGAVVMTMIHHLAVSDQARRQGLARVMVQKALRTLYARPHGSRRAYVTVLENNRKAQKFWASLGFTNQSQGPLWLYTMDLDPHKHPWLAP